MFHVSRAAFQRSLKEAAGGMEGMFSAFLSTSPAEGNAKEAKCTEQLCSGCLGEAAVRAAVVPPTSILFICMVIYSSTTLLPTSHALTCSLAFLVF